MPTVRTRPWSTQYRDNFKRTSKPRHVTIKATPITYPLPPGDKYLPVGRPGIKLPSTVSKPKAQDDCNTKSRLSEKNVDQHWNSRHSQTIDVNDQPPIRPYSTPNINRIPTPFKAEPGDIEDRPDTVQPSYVFGANEAIEKGTALTFVPELKSWVSNANTEYERNAVVKVSQTMQRGFTPVQRSRSVSPMRTRPFYGRSVSYGEGGFGYPQELGYSQTWNPYSMPNPDMAMTEGYVPSMPRHLEGMAPLTNFSMYPQTARESRPMARHLRRGSLSRGYVHDLSCFQSTQPMVSGHFVIHPDWVSERMTPRRKPMKKAQIQY